MTFITLQIALASFNHVYDFLHSPTLKTNEHFYILSQRLLTEPMFPKYFPEEEPLK
jgi:hypothetical protein